MTAMTMKPGKHSIAAHRCAEFALEAGKSRENPWEEITVAAVMTGPDGAKVTVPAFWDGGDSWRVRLTAPAPGAWQVRTECSDPSDAGLHGRTAVLEVGPAVGDNPLWRHGAVRIAAKKPSFEHLDGTRFTWLGDTWWMVMSERIAWPDGFKRLVAHRAGQGFTVAQVVVGFQPDTVPFDGRDENAGGSPWEKEYRRINPAFFQACDRRLAHMVESGIVPCIVGGWGYHSLFMGKDRTIAHWRYLVARYAAWPVIWCLAGEGAMAYYLSQDRPADNAKQKAVWPDVARAVRAADPWRRPISLHPRSRSWDDTDDPATLDFFMLQSGHQPGANGFAVEMLAIGRDRFPEKIIVLAEPPYEGHGGMNWSDVQRYAYWSAILSGARGYTYGAAGIFQANDRERPTGHRPNTGAFDGVFWDEALLFQGAEHIAAGHRFLRTLPFNLFQPHPEWVEVAQPGGAANYIPPFRTYAAGIPGECRLIFVPGRMHTWKGPLVKRLEPGVRYRAAYVETNTAKRHELGEACGDADGNWQAPGLPHMYDWLLLLERA